MYFNVFKERDDSFVGKFHEDKLSEAFDQAGEAIYGVPLDKVCFTCGESFTQQEGYIEKLPVSPRKEEEYFYCENCVGSQETPDLNL